MKYGKGIILILTAAALTLGIQACKLSSDVKDNITSAQDFSIAETEFAGAFDITDDINQSDGKVKKGGSTLLPSGAILTWIDSVYDADGIEYNLDFGPLGSSAPYGMVCGDGKYRAGKLNVVVNLRYLTVGSAVYVKASNTALGDYYYSGDGTNMVAIEGMLTVRRTADQELTVKMDDGIVYKELDKGTPTAGKSCTFSGTKVITRTKGAATPGLLGDEYEVSGSGGGKNVDGEDYKWTITSNLLKKIEVGCANTFVKGIIEIKNVSASSSLKVDFDPYSNGACDKVAKAIIGSKEIIFVVK